MKTQKRSVCCYNPNKSVKALETVNNVDITRLLVDAEKFGHCMALFGRLRTAGSCKNGWLSFDCAGQFVSKRLRDGIVSGSDGGRPRETVVVFYEPAERHNGYCVVKRITFKLMLSSR